MISSTPWRQEALDELAKLEEFTTTFEQEVETCGLTAQRVRACFHRLDSLVSEPLLFDVCSTGVIPKGNLTNVERAALVIIFKVQERFPRLIFRDKILASSLQLLLQVSPHSALRM